MTRNFTLASQVEILLRTAICQADGCTNPLIEAVEWDHRIPWAISKDRSAKNGDALCPACHAKKTNKESFGGKSDKATIAKCKRVHRKHTGDIQPKGTIQGRAEPWPKGPDPDGQARACFRRAGRFGARVRSTFSGVS